MSALKGLYASWIQGRQDNRGQPAPATFSGESDILVVGKYRIRKVRLLEMWNGDDVVLKESDAESAINALHTGISVKPDPAPFTRLGGKPVFGLVVGQDDTTSVQQPRKARRLPVERLVGCATVERAWLYGS